MSSGGATSNILLALVFYVVLTSGIIAYVSMENEAILIGDLDVRTLESVDFTISEFSDFDYKVLSGKWYLDEVKGLYCEDNWLSNEITFNRLLQPDSQIFENRYTIVHGGIEPYYVLVRKTGLYYDTIMLKVDGNWIYLESGKIPLLPYSYREVFYHDLSKYEGEYSITTKLNEVDNTVEVKINDVLVNTFTGIPNKNILSWGYVYYNGILTYHSMSIKDFGAEGKTVIDDEKGFFAFGDDSWINTMKSFLSHMGMILFWNVSGIPMLLNMVFVKVPILVISFIIVQTVRGSG